MHEEGQVTFSRDIRPHSGQRLGREHERRSGVQLCVHKVREAAANGRHVTLSDGLISDKVGIEDSSGGGAEVSSLPQKRDNGTVKLADRRWHLQ